MKNLKLPITLSCLIAFSMLGGCAAAVKSGGSESLQIPASAKQNLVVNFKGNEKVVQNDDWPLLKSDWSKALHTEAVNAGYNLQEATSLPVTQSDGVGITVNVTNFRYLTPGARVGAGIMVGNAWVNSSADFSDLNSGRLIGTRTYDTSSSAWEGVASAMTRKQVNAIAKQIISDIKSAKAE